MKICVYFEPKDINDDFEGKRLRKTIKGSLEMVNVPYTRNLVENYDILHVLSAGDELKINDAIQTNHKVVFSALITETDIVTRLYELKNNCLVMSPRYLRTLNKVDVILVCDECSKELLITSGVKTKIVCVPLGINTSRFEMTSELESDLFYNYFQLDKRTKYIVSIGSFEDKDEFSKLIEIAKLCPNYRFFYFGKGKTKKSLPKSKKIPKNLEFHLLLNQDIYCSMMRNALAYLSFDNRRRSPLTLFDAAASKTQIISLKPNNYNEEILTKLKAVCCNTSYEVSKTIDAINNGEYINNVEQVYKVARANSLKKLGTKLIEIYNNLLKGESL